MGTGTTVVDNAKKYWWVPAVAVPVLVAIIGIAPRFLESGSSGSAITLNQDSHDVNFTSISVLENEYRQRTGEALPADLRPRLEQAQRLLEQRQYTEGIPVLQEVAEKLQVASAFGDLGTALAMTGNRSDAETAFQKAASIDPATASVAQGRRYVNAGTSNNQILTAAEIPLARVVGSTLFDGDEDYFQFTTPAGPRDYMRLQIKNLSTTLFPSVVAFNPEKSRIGHTTRDTAADVEYIFPTSPSRTHYVQVAPHFSQGGAYSLKIDPMRSFDNLEPNDEITAAKDIAVGRTIEVNIMDANDVDYYKFTASSAKTSILIENRSSTLHPQLTVFDARKARIGYIFADDAADLHYEFDSTPGATYHILIGPHFSEGGRYALTVK